MALEVPRTVRIDKIRTAIRKLVNQIILAKEDWVETVNRVQIEQAANLLTIADKLLGNIKLEIKYATWEEETVEETGETLW